MKNIVAALLAVCTVVGVAHAQNRVNAGQTYEGELTANHPRLRDNSHVECFQLQTVQGRQYTITLRSRAFDAFLLADRAGCGAPQPALRNDDFENGTTDSQLSFVGDGAIYGVFVNSYAPNQTGRYALTIAEAGAVAARAPSAATPPAGDQNWTNAWAAFERRDYATALRLIRPYADAGEPSAQNMMGYTLFNGLGVERNMVEAGRWYGLAAAQGHEPSQRQLNLLAPHIAQARFVEHVDRYGPSTADVHSFHYDVNVYCIYRGPNCSTWRRRAQEFQDAWNARAEAANMRRIWGLYGGNSEQEARQYRERSECLRRVTESIERQTYGQQTWRYVNNC